MVLHEFQGLLSKAEARRSKVEGQGQREMEVPDAGCRLARLPTPGETAGLLPPLRDAGPF